MDLRPNQIHSFSKVQSPWSLVYGHSFKVYGLKVYSVAVLRYLDGLGI